MHFMSPVESKSKMVYEDDLVPFLQNLGIYEDLMAGKFKCRVTGEVITLENLEAIIPENGMLFFLTAKGLAAGI